MTAFRESFGGTLEKYRAFFTEKTLDRLDTAFGTTFPKKGGWDHGSYERSLACGEGRPNKKI